MLSVESTQVASLDTLDPKVTMSSLTETSVYEHSTAFFKKFSPQTPDQGVWIIEDFLTEPECQGIVESCRQQGFGDIEHLYSKEYRESKRLLAFDENNCLTETIKQRLANDDLLSRIASKGVAPYGFGNQSLTWAPVDGEINPCFRFNYYCDSSGFDWHRDAQYTRDFDCRSSYSIVIYLNEGFSGGETVFMLPNSAPTPSGLSMPEELALIGDSYREITVKPRTGLAVIFDQRLIHRGNALTGEKFLVRTDLLSRATGTFQLSPLEKRIYQLTCALFRQAQYYELECDRRKEGVSVAEAREKAQGLYDITISLRQDPGALTSYPERLESLLEPLYQPHRVTDRLRFVSRTGKTWTYRYDSGDHLETLVKIAAVYSLLNEVNRFDEFFEEDDGDKEDGAIDETFRECLEELGLAHSNEVRIERPVELPAPSPPEPEPVPEPIGPYGTYWSAERKRERHQKIGEAVAKMRQENPTFRKHFDFPLERGKFRHKFVMNDDTYEFESFHLVEEEPEVPLSIAYQIDAEKCMLTLRCTCSLRDSDDSDEDYEDDIKYKIKDFESLWGEFKGGQGQLVLKCQEEPPATITITTDTEPDTTADDTDSSESSDGSDSDDESDDDDEEDDDGDDDKRQVEKSSPSLEELVKRGLTTVKGTVRFLSRKGETFNHASCQCEPKYRCPKETSLYFRPVVHRIRFTVSTERREISLTFHPMVCM
jgi:hypothetical protein